MPSTNTSPCLFLSLPLNASIPALQIRRLRLREAWSSFFFFFSSKCTVIFGGRRFKLRGQTLGGGQWWEPFPGNNLKAMQALTARGVHRGPKTTHHGLSFPAPLAPKDPSPLFSHDFQMFSIKIPLRIPGSWQATIFTSSPRTDVWF